jgi:heme oxygenase (biliverdin-IX-beta and delta-forming)
MDSFMPAEDLSTVASYRGGVFQNSRGAASLRNLLKDGTAAAHARLDGAIAAIDLRTQLQYCRFLEAQAQALLPLEATLADSGVRRLFPDWEQRFRSRVLVEDITLLGGDVQPFSTLDRLDDDAIVGTMYVLEGSRLGAAYLLKAVQESPDPAVRETTAYLSHGAGTRLWPNFLKTLESYAAKLPDPAAMLDAAQKTFALFEAAMTRFVPPPTEMVATASHP